MADIQLYTGEIPDYYSQDQIQLLDQKLDPRLIKSRKEGWRNLQYIEGHTAIDQANRIFGYGNWGWRVLECELENVIDPVSGEGIGAIYNARVEVWVRGMQGTIIDIGSQPVSVSSVEEQIVSRRIADAEKQKRTIDEGPFTFLEKKNARAMIMQAHEQARKGAGTDGLKRGLRGLGNQFANGLYGDGQVDVSTPPPVDGKTVNSKPSQQQPKPLPVAVPKIADLYNSGGQIKLWSNKAEFMTAIGKILGLESVPGDFNPTVEQRQKIATHIEEVKQAMLVEADQATGKAAS